MRNLSDYPKTLANSEALPYGMLKNESIPGARDGTDIKAEQLQDLYYPLYQVLGLAGQVPNGELENAGDSKQFLSSLANISWLRYDSSLIYGKNSIVLNTINDVTTAYRSIVNNNTLPLDDETGWKAIFTIDAEHNFQICGGGGYTSLINSLYKDPNFHKAITPDYTRVITLGNGAAIPDYGFLHAVFWVSVQNVNIELHHSTTGQVIELGRQHLSTNENFDMPSITLPVSPGWTIHYSMKCVCWHVYFCPFHQV